MRINAYRCMCDDASCICKSKKKMCNGFMLGMKLKLHGTLYSISFSLLHSSLPSYFSHWLSVFLLSLPFPSYSLSHTFTPHSPSPFLLLLPFSATT